MGMKNLAFIGTFLVTLLFVISSLNAQIIISQPNSLYSLGDTLNFEVKLDQIKTGYLDVNLICNQEAQNIYHNVPDSKTLLVERDLIPIYIGNISGDCILQSTYDGDSQTTSNFKISNQLLISLATAKIVYNIGEIKEVKGTATKENNQLVGLKSQTAVIEMTLGDLRLSELVKDGQFTLKFNLSEKTKSGIYRAEILVYDKDSEGNILNFGRSGVDIEVIQKPEKIEIALANDSANLGDNFKIIPFVQDFAGDPITTPVLMQIIDSNSKKLFEGYVGGGQDFILEITKDIQPGTVKILVQKDNLLAEKYFEILTTRKISSNLENYTLTLVNEGNVLYDDIVEVIIGANKILQKVKIPVAENVQYELQAPDGDYEFSIKNNDQTLFSANVPLTGNAISMTDIRNKGSNIWRTYPIVWIFLAIVIFMFAWIYYRKYLANRRLFEPLSFGVNKKKKEEIKKKGGIEIVNPTQVMDKIATGVEIRKAEQVLVLHGQNSQAGIIAIKVKNENGIVGIAKDNLNKALEYGYNLKGVSYNAGNYVLLIFSPLMTKNNKNPETAIKVATEIDNYLKEHNRKFRNDVLHYGIGVNSGEIINKVEGKVLQFTNMGKTISMAKRAAEAANDTVMLTKEIHEKTMNSVKTEKATSGSMDLYTVKRVVDTEQSQKFIQGFLRRNNPN